MSLTVAELMSRMPDAFLPEKALGMEADIQFRFTGAESGEWFARIKDGHCTVNQGILSNARMTLSADSGDFLKIFKGELDPMQAFMQGKLILSGDLNLALKLLSMFKVR